jgi:hypothetical protein
MPFKGNIRKGSHVVAQLSLAPDVSGSALIAIAFTDNDGASGDDSMSVAPGATGTCSVRTHEGPNGRLRVFVDFSLEADTGQLIVRVDGADRHNETITGDTTWAYSLS